MRFVAALASYFVGIAIVLGVLAIAGVAPSDLTDMTVLLSLVGLLGLALALAVLADDS